MLTFDWTIRAGDVVTLVGGVSVAVGIFYKRGRADEKLTNAVTGALKEISELKDEMKSVSKALTQLAIQEMKINMLMKWYDELRNGIGLISKEK